MPGSGDIMVPNLMEHMHEQEPELNDRSELHIGISALKGMDDVFWDPMAKILIFEVRCESE